MRRPTPIRCLVAGLGPWGVEGAMVEPLRWQRRALFRAFGLRSTFVRAPTLDDLGAAVREHGPQVAFVLTHWATPVEETTRFFERWCAEPGRSRIVYLDFFDATASPFFGIVPFVDVYAKKQLLRDRALYRADLAGGYIHTDFMVRRGTKLADWHFGSHLDEGVDGRVQLSWNLGVTREHYQTLRRRVAPLRTRPVDVHCILNVGRNGEDGWYTQHRRDFLDAAAGLGRDFAIDISGHEAGAGLSRRAFLRGMERAKLVVSPFGWGELCVRDFEALARGCLLVKPDVSHLVTVPDLFEAGETYIPVAWDGSDLAAVCRDYLARPEECQRIVDRARQRYLEFFESNGVVERVGHLLSAAGALSNAASATERDV